MKVEQLTEALAVHGEGPAWSPHWAGPRWVDMLQGDVLELQSDGTVRRVHVADVACVVRRRHGSGMLVATEHDLVLAEGDELGGRVSSFVHLIDDPAVRLNDGGVAPDGRFFVGSMAYDYTPGAGTLWAISGEGSVSVVEPGATISNGLAWSPDGSTAYYSDTATHRVDRFSWSPSKGLYDRRAFVSVNSPDGVCVDAEGGVWVALWGGGALHRYDSVGSLTAIVRIPTQFPTSAAFVGDNLDRLIVTTSRLEAPDDPLAGALFEVVSGVRGIPLSEFSG